MINGHWNFKYNHTPEQYGLERWIAEWLVRN